MIYINMKRPTKKPRPKRTYESELRREQAAATRSRIVDAFLEELKDGASEVSIPSVASRARVAVPTVYRHFPERAELLREAVATAEARLGPLPPPDPGDPEAQIRAFFGRRAAMEAQFPGMISSPLVWAIRREVTIPARRKYVDAVIARRAPNATEPERTWLSDLLVVLVSSVTAKALEDYVGVTGDAAADRVLWAIDAMFERADRGAASANTKGRKR